MLKPLEQFICDECGEVINSPKEGYVEWECELLPNDKVNNHGFRIVHAAYASPRKTEANREGCYKYGRSPHRHDIGLEYFLKNLHQIMYSMLDEPRGEDHSESTIQDYAEFVEFFRRLTIPYYEEARFYLNQAKEDEFIGGGLSSISAYLPELLESVAKEYSIYD